MTPLEINKKIAEMQGFKVIYIPDFDWQAYEETRMPITNYAEHISDAWKLFEEMDGQVITQDRYNGAYSGGKWLCTYETLCPEEVLINGPQAGDTEAMEFWADPVHVAAADTAPLAIAKAWLAWKESKK